jgi:hypothetical protein
MSLTAKQAQDLQSIAQQPFGAQGAPQALAAAGTITGNFSTIQVWDATTKISSITINGTPITAFAALALPVGFCVYGVITSCTISAGAILGIYGDFTGQ